ncbi:fibronectin type III domain-containing protein [Aequorivita todarodis]|uniref:fibronectin type III domain-containing protein n=1 Tax=Aequorivita todarodis TaxID=2036821 RepID=UPI0023509A2C|nr:fibronectin type III domain-containing protein [Aequorivita todarodis]MDC8002347.1 fibronectin type III domain-containing protein [Aequorivita todarodis]
MLLIVLGCNKDDTDDNPDPINNAPSDFEISVTDITPSSANLNWTASTSVEPTTMVYAVYLNDSLLAENLTETFYDLSNLDDSTNYTVKIEAVNEFGIAQATTVFTTAELNNLRLKEYLYEDGRSIKIQYNEDDQVNLKYMFDFLQTIYTYTNGKIISENRYNQTWGNVYVDYTYNQNQELVHLKTSEYYFYSSDHYTYNFDSTTNYTYTHRRYVDYDTYTYNYSVNIILNDDGNIVNYEELNLDTSELLITTFEYTNGNMTKLVTPDGNVLEIVYDDKKSFHTYKSRFPQYPKPIGEIFDATGLIYIDSIPVYSRAKFIPQFYDYVNKNNPLEYKLDGQVKTTFEYVYNEDDYPSSLKANFQDGTSTGVVNLNYE